eukprot:4135342-Amphidinium_carterae.1
MSVSATLGGCSLTSLKSCKNARSPAMIALSKCKVFVELNAPLIQLYSTTMSQEEMKLKTSKWSQYRLPMLQKGTCKILPNIRTVCDDVSSCGTTYHAAGTHLHHVLQNHRRISERYLAE